MSELTERIKSSKTRLEDQVYNNCTHHTFRNSQVSHWEAEKKESYVDSFLEHPLLSKLNECGNIRQVYLIEKCINYEIILSL